MKEVFSSYGAVPKPDGEFEFVTMGQYASTLTANVKNLSAPQVAIVYADGAIVDGEGYGKEVYGNSLAAKLAEVRKDDRVKAVVLRVNSPGGSALASDVIWHEMELLREQKPVVVSMGSYAASGGYYISCGADVIVADKTTLTGSIGVLRHVHAHGGCPEKQTGYHRRCRSYESFGRCRDDASAHGARACGDHARGGSRLRNLHLVRGCGTQPAAREGARNCTGTCLERYGRR